MKTVKLAVILAAGLGSRLKDRTKEMPKGFIEIEGKTLIERSLDALFDHGIERVIIGTGHHSEYYEQLAEKRQEISCVKNPVFAETGSMFTLYNCLHDIKEDFFLLESDLLYDSDGIKILQDEKNEDVILASGKTNSGDEVYIDTNSASLLVNMSKRVEDMNAIDTELVGISKISIGTFKDMCKFAAENFKLKPKLDYEYVFVGLSKVKPIFVKRVENFVWCEIDDESHLERATKSILPKLKSTC